jgi:hypothetical protein
MTAPQTVKGVRLADEDLSESLLGFLMEVRAELGPYGWSIYAEQYGTQLSFEFRNPLSPVSRGMVFDPQRSISDIRNELTDNLAEEPEFAHTKLAVRPRRKRDLIGGIRWAATSYGWLRRVYDEVIDTLRTFSVLSEDEWHWLRTVGPDVLRSDLKRNWRRHMKAHEQPRKAEGQGRSRTKRSS